MVALRRSLNKMLCELEINCAMISQMFMRNHKEDKDA